MVNTVMLVAVLREIGSLIERDITKMKANKYRTTAKAMLVFMPMVGLPWIFGFFALNSSLVMFDYIFTTLNGFQGLSLFMILVVGNKEVRNRLQGRIDDLNKAYGEKTNDCRDKGVSVVTGSTTGASLSTTQKVCPGEAKMSFASPWTTMDDEGDVTMTSLDDSEGDLNAI
ncbi:adhesion G-protein coupled receptor D1-like [Asterias rubens]|nr:adhesion G-protein coupled receptor D1-like [Asterias rubens]